MFTAIARFTEQPVTQEWTVKRARWEPLYENTQMKGDGETHEQVYNVAWSDHKNRKLSTDDEGNEDPAGDIPDVGNTVDVETATWEDSIGAGELTGFWKDPDFNPSQDAFYYARVIEIPTPRWTGYDTVIYDIEMDPDVPLDTTERAYTSPIWYSANPSTEPTEPTEPS